MEAYYWTVVYTEETSSTATHIRSNTLTLTSPLPSFHELIIDTVERLDLENPRPMSLSKKLDL